MSSINVFGLEGVQVRIDHDRGRHFLPYHLPQMPDGTDTETRCVRYICVPGVMKFWMRVVIADDFDWKGADVVKIDFFADGMRIASKLADRTGTHRLDPFNFWNGSAWKAATLGFKAWDFALDSGRRRLELVEPGTIRVAVQRRRFIRMHYVPDILPVITVPSVRPTPPLRLRNSLVTEGIPCGVSIFEERFGDYTISRWDNCIPAVGERAYLFDFRYRDRPFFQRLASPVPSVSDSQAITMPPPPPTKIKDELWYHAEVDTYNWQRQKVHDQHVELSKAWLVSGLRARPNTSTVTTENVNATENAPVDTVMSEGTTTATGNNPVDQRDDPGGGQEKKKEEASGPSQ